MTNSQKMSILPPPRILTCGKGILFVLLAFAAVLFTSIAFADTYTLTTRYTPNDAPFDGKTYTQLDSTDKLVVTANNAQLYFTGVSSATLECNIDISGNRSDRTGKFRMQMAANAPVNINGTVNLVGNTIIASHNWSTNQGKLTFNGLITGDGGLIVAPGYLTQVHLNNTQSVNNYKGNTQIGSTDIYNNSNVTTYAGTLVLEADEQIPDVLTAGSASTGNLVLYSWTDASSRLTSTLNLNGHTETVNGLVTTDSLSVVTGTSGSKLRVGANNDTSTYAGNLQGAMELEKIGTGTLTLSKAPAHTGSTTVTAGTLALSAGGTLYNLSGAGEVAYGANALTLNNTSNSDFSGVLSGTGAVTKTGSGTFSLSGAASMSSPSVTVNDGVFQSGVSIASTDVIVSGGTFGVGDTPNSANITTQSLTLNSGSLCFDFNDSTVSNDYDRLQTGAISSSSGSVNLSFNYGDELTWWNTIGSTGVCLVSGSSLSDISSVNITVNGAATSSWELSAQDNSIYLIATGSAPAASEFWYANNPSDAGQDSWTIDGTSKQGIKLLAGNNTTTFSKPVVMSGNGSVEVKEDFNLTLSGQVSGSGALEKTGAGTLTLSGNNSSYTGAPTVSEGTLKVTNSSNMGTGTATVASGATVEIATDSSASAAWTWTGGNISGSGTLKVTGGGEFEMPISKMKISNGSIIADGTHLMLSEASGAYHISGLTINVNNGGTVEFARTSDSYVGLYFDNTLHINFDQNGGGTLQTGDKGNSYMNLISASQITFTTNGGATNYITGTNGINTHNFNLIFDVAKGTSANGVDLDVSARIWNSKGIIKNGDGTLAITGNNTDDNGYSGGTTINAGTIRLAGDGTLGKGGVTNNSILEFAYDSNKTFGNVISGSGKVIKIGDKTLTITGKGTFTGGTTINAGTLTLSGGGVLGTGGISVASNATLAFADDLTATTISNTISGVGKIIKDGTNTVNINGTFTSFTGDMTINGGKVSLLVDGGKTFQVKNLSGSGDLELRLAATSATNTYISSITNDNFTGYISLVQQGNANGNKINTNSTSFDGFKFKVNNGTSIYISGAEFKADAFITGNGNSENRGALRIGNTVSGAITLTGNASIGIDGNGRTISGAITSGAASGETTLFINGKTDGTSVTANRNTGSFTGSISDGDSGSKLGLRIVVNTHTFSGDLSYTGATIINADSNNLVTKMILSGANANLKNSSAVTVNGAIDFTGYTGENAMQLNNLSGTDGVIVGTGKDLILNNDQLSKFIGSITAKNITKTGDGTLQIYTGATGQVDAQSLVVSSGRMDFKGYLTGGITVDANAVFSPGNSIGEARFGGGYILNDGATLLMEIGGSDVESNDSLYNTTADGTLTINGMIDLVLASNSTLKGGDEFVAVLSGSNSGDDGFADYLLSKVNSYYFTNLEYVQLDGSYGAYSGKYAIKGILDSNAVPEPSTWALLALGVAGLMYWRKRKNA